LFRIFPARAIVLALITSYVKISRRVVW